MYNRKTYSQENYKFTLSGTYNVPGKPAEVVFNLLKDVGLLWGNVWASWCEDEQKGYIKVALRQISMAMEVQHLPQNEYLELMQVVTCNTKVPEAKALEVYREVLHWAKNYNVEGDFYE